MRFSKLVVFDLAKPLYHVVQNVMPEIKRIYSIEAEYRGVADLPPFRDFGRRKSQVDADGLLRHYSNSIDLPNGSLGLLLTEKDLFVSIYNFIFGLAEPELRWAVLSTFRLHAPSKRVYLSRVKKEVVHELGHLLGLAHCDNKFCVMSFSNTVEEVDQKDTTLCAQCQLILPPRLQ